jgi:putative DNA methylase
VKIPGEVDAGVECHSVEDLQSGTRRFLLVQGSSVSLPLPAASVDHIVTDPPYFDSVQYSDLAAYFRVWLRQLLPDEANWDYSLDAAAVNQQQNGSDQYAAVLADIFRECHRVLRKEHGRLVFTFHHWNPQGWAGLTKALMAGDFVLINRYVIHAENPSSVHIVNQNALVHDAVLVLGSRGTQGEHAWTLPATVDKTDSESFCAQCAQALGYMLETACSADEIVRLWHDLVRV